MRGLIFGIAGSLLLASPVFCQVDTLMLVEIGSIEAPAEITDLYVEDLDGDSLKEIILTTAANIHIYHGITYEEIWTSPELVNPQDLLFEDINSDALIDLSVKDTTNIHLFDPHNDTVIWTSPAIDSTYSCYTIGDRNDDDWIDVAIVSKEPFTRPGIENNVDTVWVEIYNGPSFALEDIFIVLLDNFTSYDYETSVAHFEWPTDVLCDKISDEAEIQNTFIISIEIDDSRAGHGGWHAGARSGRIFVVYDDGNRDYFSIESGSIMNLNIIEMNNARYMYAVGDVLNWANVDFYSNGSEEVSLYVLGVDSLIYSSVLFEDEWNSNGDPRERWAGSVIDEISNQYSNPEICYGINESLFLFTLPELDTIWRIDNVPYYFNVKTVFKYLDIYPAVQIFCQIGYGHIDYAIFNGPDGMISAVIPNPDYDLADVSDVDLDGNDEILSIDETDLYIYGLQRTGIEDKSVLPDRPQLLSNYPNPFNSSTTIEYSLPQAGHVTIDIYDLLGRKLETPVDEEQEAGAYQVVWDAGAKSSGIYFYRITSGVFTETRIMVLLK